VGLVALAAGSVAFALAPFLGRAGSAWIAGFILFAGYLLNGQATVPALAGIAHLSWFSWTAGHVPLAGQWASLLPVAVVSVVLLAVGVEAFARRDLGVSTSLRLRAYPGRCSGCAGPSARLRRAAAVGSRLGPRPRDRRARLRGSQPLADR
jgi:ABC-2 type transport system permease protein